MTQKNENDLSHKDLLDKVNKFEGMFAELQRRKLEVVIIYYYYIFNQRIQKKKVTSISLLEK